MGRMTSGVCDCVCVCPSVRALKTKRLGAKNAKLGRHTVHDSRTACIDPEVERSKVKVTRLSNELPAWVCMSIGLLRFPVIESLEKIIINL